MKKLLTILLCGTIILGAATGCTEQKEDTKKDPEVQENLRENAKYKNVWV